MVKQVFLVLFPQGTLSQLLAYISFNVPILAFFFIGQVVYTAAPTILILSTSTFVLLLIVLLYFHFFFSLCLFPYLSLICRTILTFVSIFVATLVFTSLSTPLLSPVLTPVPVSILTSVPCLFLLLSLLFFL